MSPAAKKSAPAAGSPRSAEPAGPAGPAGGPEIEGFEQARDALVEIVRTLEAGNLPLEESLALWERGEALATRCEQWLAGARSRLDAVAPTD